MKLHIIITQSEKNRFGCMFDAHPEQIEDFRDGDGKPAKVVLSAPLSVAIAAPDLLAACRAVVDEECHCDEVGLVVKPCVKCLLRAAIKLAEGGVE